MEERDNNPLPHLILTDRSQLQELDSIQSGRTIIVKLDDAEDGTGHMFQAYTTSVDNLEKGDGETEIAFEIIQEPLLNEDGSVENRLFFEPDYHLEREIHQPKENLQIISVARGKEDEHIIVKAEESQSSALANYSVEELGYNNANNDASKVDLRTNSSSLSSLPNVLPSTTDTIIKLEVLDHENVTNPEVIKKTTVEAFVKMIVCRKITVQKKDAKTGDILDVDVKMEEEEPVVLGVDYVETTEDAISGNISKQTRSVTGADTDLKAISAISEKSQKFSKNLFTNSLLQSALRKKISKVLQSDQNILPSSSNSDSQLSQQVSNDKKGSVHSDSDDEWMEDFNDDSADYIPFPNPKHKQSEIKQRKIHKGTESSKIGEINNASSSGHVNVKIEKEDGEIHLPKKRGRKRKWDRTIGLASNMKICQFCNKHFDSVSSCNKHMKKGTCVSSHFCFICSKTFDSEQQLEVHISSHRNNNKRSSYDCTDCRRSYRTKSGYVKHFKMGTCTKREIFEDGKTGEFCCEFCDSRFSSLEYLHLHHYKVHENPKDRHVCPNCGRTFYSLQGFQRHRSGRPCTEPLKCHICGKTYKAKESFKLHMKHHKSEITGITFNCDECGRSYMTEAALTKHKLLHTGVKPYKCDVCGKEFAMRYQVKDHARMHSGEKPYSCTLCNVAFSNKGHLGRHLRSHENGTLLRRGRPKKVQEPESSNVRISSSGSGVPGEPKIKLGQTLKTMDGQMIQVIDSGQIFNSQGDAPPPMIIQADTNTIIIAEGWPENAVPVSQTVVNAPNNNSSNNETTAIGS